MGPNLTDDHYKHLSDLEGLAKVVLQGAANNAMPAWSNRLHPNEVVLVSAYVASLRGTMVEGGKQPEGREIPAWNIAASEKNADSTDASGNGDAQRANDDGGSQS